MSWSRTGARLFAGDGKRTSLVAALCLCAVVLSACGFQPLYAKPENAAVGPMNDLASIYIVPLEDRVGQVFHNFLRDRLNPRGLPRSPAYVLRVQLKESVEELAIRSDETATRGNLRLRAEFMLSRRESDAVLFSGLSNSIASFNILNSEFATHTSREDARQRGLRELSDKIRIQLATFFNRARSDSAS